MLGVGIWKSRHLSKGALPVTWEVAVVWERDPGGGIRDEVESLMGELIHGVGEAPKLFWRGDASVVLQIC